MAYVDEEVRVNQHLSNDQLLDITARYLRILEDRLDNKRTIEHQQVHNLQSRRQMLDTTRKVLEQCHDLVLSGKAQGFVFGLITENKTWSASSDNLFKWWKEDINFEQNGPKAIVPAISQSLGLETLKNLQDSTLSSIISALMPHCTPPQRLSPFSAGRPVSWWPKGTEEWWPQLNFLSDSGPPEYKQPHGIKKNWKIAVLVAIIKNLEPDFAKIRRHVAESLFVQSKMTSAENHVWLAVIKGEEMQISLKLQQSAPYNPRLSNGGNVLGTSGIESGSPAAADKKVKVENFDIGDNCDKVGEGESSRENKKRAASDEVMVVAGEIDSLSVKNTAREGGEGIGQLKLKGIQIPEPKRSKLPHRTNPLCMRGHAMQVPMSERSLFYRNLEMLASMQIGWAGKLSLGSMNGEVQVKTNNNASNQSSTQGDHFEQSYASLTLTRDQEEGSSNPSYSIKQDPVNMSQFQSKLSGSSSFQPNMSIIDESCIKVENHATNNVKTSASSEPKAVDKQTNSTSVQGSVNLSPQVHQLPMDSTKQYSRDVINHQFQNQFNSNSTEQGSVKHEPEE